MFRPRHIAVLAAIVAAVPAIGINRIVVTDGKVAADSSLVAFKSDYLPLER
jgi:hypothetical protein